MRRGMLVALACAVSCAAPRPYVSIGERGESVDTLVARHPLAAGANIRADEIARTATTSTHVVQVRQGESPHRHERHDLTVAVLRGEGVLAVGGTRRAMRAGDVAVVARGTPHWFTNTGRHPAVALVVFGPPLDAPDNVPVGAGVDTPAAAR